MLLNGVHLLPDLSGALVWPKQRLVAIADPLPSEHRVAAREAVALVKQMASVLRQKRPERVVWLGGTLPGLHAADSLGKREADELDRMVRAHDWAWVAEGGELAVDALVFRPDAQPKADPGEVAARPSPMAGLDGTSFPCFVIDGRRLVLPAFGPRLGGIDVLSPAFQPLFRRPFQALMLAGGRIVTRPRARLT